MNVCLEFHFCFIKSSRIQRSENSWKIIGEVLIPAEVGPWWFLCFECYFFQFQKNLLKLQKSHRVVPEKSRLLLYSRNQPYLLKLAENIRKRPEIFGPVKFGIKGFVLMIFLCDLSYFCSLCLAFHNSASYNTNLTGRLSKAAGKLSETFLLRPCWFAC